MMIIMAGPKRCGTKPAEKLRRVRTKEERERIREIDPIRVLPFPCPILLLLLLRLLLLLLHLLLLFYTSHFSRIQYIFPECFLP